MKHLLFPFVAAALLSGCGTVFYENGQPLARIHADATNLTIKTRGTYIHADALNHSRPTLAAGTAIAKNIQSAATAMTAAGAAFATKGFVP